MVAVDLILFKLADKEEIHNIWDVFKFWPDWMTCTTGLPALEHPKIPPGGYNGEIGVYSFSWLLAHLSRRLIGELIVYQWSGVRRRRRPSVVHNAQTSYSHKPVGRSKPNFMWSLLG